MMKMIANTFLYFIVFMFFYLSGFGIGYILGKKDKEMEDENG